MYRIYFDNIHKKFTPGELRNLKSQIYCYLIHCDNLFVLLFYFFTYRFYLFCFISALHVRLIYTTSYLLTYLLTYFLWFIYTGDAQRDEL